MKSPNGKIRSALYCEKAIKTILEAEKNGKHSNSLEGKIVLQEESQ